MTRSYDMTTRGRAAADTPSASLASPRHCSGTAPSVR